MHIIMYADIAIQTNRTNACDIAFKQKKQQ